MPDVTRRTRNYCRFWIRRKISGQDSPISDQKSTLYNSRRLVSASSMSRSLINIDGQDKQDDLLMVWAACSGTRVVTFLSSTITFSSTRIPKPRSHAHGSLHRRTRSSSGSASRAAASRPVYPVYRCSLMQQTGLAGHGPYSRKAIRIRCFTLE